MKTKTKTNEAWDDYTTELIGEATEAIGGIRPCKISTAGKGSMSRVTFDISELMTMAGTEENDGEIYAVPESPNPDRMFTTRLSTEAAYYITSNSADTVMTSTLLASNPHAFITEEGSTWTIEHVGLTKDAGGRIVTTTPDEAGGVTLAEAGTNPDKLYALIKADTGEPFTLADASKSVAFTYGLMRIIANASNQEADEGRVTVLSNAYIMQYMRGIAKGRQAKPYVVCTNAKGEVVEKISAITDVLVLSPSGRKTFMLLNSEITRMLDEGMYRRDGETVCRVVMSVKETAERCGLTERSMRKKLLRDFKELDNQRFTLRADSHSVRQVDISGGGFEVSGDRAMFAVSPDFMRFVMYLRSSWLDLPVQLLKTDDGRYRAAFQLGVKICNHDNQNQGKPNQSWMKLTTLLRAATEIPRADTLSKRYSKTERIMKPFEANMNHLRDIDVLTDWDYCHKEGDPLTDEEYMAVQAEHDLGKPTPWELAADWCVTWELAHRWPEREEARQVAREKNKAAAIEAKAEKEKKAKARERGIERRIRNKKAKERIEAEERAAE